MALSVSFCVFHTERWREKSAVAEKLYLLNILITSDFLSRKTPIVSALHVKSVRNICATKRNRTKERSWTITVWISERQFSEDNPFFFKRLHMKRRLHRLLMWKFWRKLRFIHGSFNIAQDWWIYSCGNGLYTELIKMSGEDGGSVECVLTD